MKKYVSFSQVISGKSGQVYFRSTTNTDQSALQGDHIQHRNKIIEIWVLNVDHGNRCHDMLVHPSMALKAMRFGEDTVFPEDKSECLCLQPESPE